MPRNPKVFIHNTVVDLCFRLEENLYFIPNMITKAIVISCLASAQTKYKVIICEYLLMSNHLHLKIVVDNPENVSNFVEYFKRESAHAINGLLGRRRHTVWVSGYDSPTVLDYKTSVKRSVYIFTNPQRANLVDKIEDYPNQSSWNALLSGDLTIRTKRIPRPAFTPLPNRQLSQKEQMQYVEDLYSQAKEDCELVITPFAWLKCFPESRDKTPEEVLGIILSEIRHTEAELRKSRELPVMGAKALKEQDFRKPYTPQKFGKKMICLSVFEEHRKKFISWAKELFGQREKGSPWPPPGLFAPGGMLYATIVPFMVPIIGDLYRM